jgi:hypothetical protein
MSFGTRRQSNMPVWLQELNESSSLIIYPTWKHKIHRWLKDSHAIRSVQAVYLTYWTTEVKCVDSDWCTAGQWVVLPSLCWKWLVHCRRVSGLAKFVLSVTGALQESEWSCQVCVDSDWCTAGEWVVLPSLCCQWLVHCRRVSGLAKFVSTSHKSKIDELNWVTTNGLNPKHEHNFRK